MASPINAVFCALVATAFWTLLGYALATRLLPRVLTIGAAPAIGWAAHSAITLPIFRLLGFSSIAVGGIGGIALILSVASIALRLREADEPGALAIPAWAFAAAALLALVPAVAILPKYSVAGVHLADPIFDHSKIAIIDAMARLGLPPVNPVFGGSVEPARLAYYYLWHYSAAELALLLHMSGWEADIGLTWFTAFASLTLMMGLAVWLGKRPAAAMLAVFLAAATSLRAVLGWIFGSYTLVPFLSPPTGFAGWLFQAAWVPQHLMSASCVVISMLLMASCAQRLSLLALVTLVLSVVAGFESSTYVGGVTFLIASLIAAPILFVRLDRRERVRFVAGLAGAAFLSVVLAAPFLRDQFAMVAARRGGAPIELHHFEVLGAMFPQTLRRVLDIPAYWLVLLPIEFPATYIAGVIAFFVLLRRGGPSLEKSAVVALCCLAAVGLVVSWLLVSTLGYNNDLALRAILPAAMILIVGAAAGLTFVPWRMSIAATALGGFVLSLPDTGMMIRSNAIGTPARDEGVFAQAPDLWTAVRRYAAPDARVANDPLFLEDLTPWPVNLSWALLANRSSCFAGKELALAFAPLSESRRDAIAAQFARVFAGQGTPQDVDDLATKYGCDVIVVVRQDGAWDNDPFAASPDYRLAEKNDDRWRIYVAARPLH